MFTSATTQVVLDVSGYYTAQLAAYVSFAGELYNATSRVVSANRLREGVFRVTFDRNVRNCTAVVSTDVNGFSAWLGEEKDANPNALQVSVANFQDILYDSNFTIIVTC